jgi:hypothetical protein
MAPVDWDRRKRLGKIPESAPRSKRALGTAMEFRRG